MIEIANACVDSNSFQTDSNGRLQPNPATAQNADLTFSHSLTGVDGTYEVINEFPAVVVPRNGLYLVHWDIHGYVALPQNNPGVTLSGETRGALALNNVFVPGTETMLCSLVEGLAGARAMAPLNTQSTGSGTRVMQLTAGQTIRIMGAQSGNGSNDSRITSGFDGRCRVTLVRISQ